MTKLLAVLALSAFAALAADATGKWSGSFNVTMDDQTKEASAYMDLKQDGNKITGTVGPSAENQFPIKAGSIDGNKIHLEVIPEHGPAMVAFELVLDGDRITGNASGEGEGHKMSAKVDVKRL